MELRISCKHRRSVLVGLLGIGCLWFSPSAATAKPVDSLQTLVNDTDAEIRLAYRQYPDERERRQEQLAAVVTAWRAAARSEANNERLATWLHAAILSSMPGSREALPPAPSFVTNLKVEVKEARPETHAEPEATKSLLEKKAPTESVAAPDADPFRDDPVSERE